MQNRQKKKRSVHTSCKHITSRPFQVEKSFCSASLNKPFSPAQFQQFVFSSASFLLLKESLKMWPSKTEELQTHTVCPRNHPAGPSTDEAYFFIFLNLTGVKTRPELLKPKKCKCKSLSNIVGFLHVVQTSGGGLRWESSKRESWWETYRKYSVSWLMFVHREL